MQSLQHYKAQTILYKGVILCLLLISLISCQTTTSKEIAEYNDRPELGLRCVSNGEGFCEDGQELKPTKNMFCMDANLALDAQDHLEKMELYRWKCKVKGKCERPKKKKSKK